MAEHVFDASVYHHAWDRELEPALAIAPGDVVHFDLLMAGDRQVHEGASFEACAFDFDTLYNLAGPVHVEGAKPGDTLAVEILSLEAGDWGWCVILPELGLLPEDFPDGFVRTFDLRGRLDDDARARRRDPDRAVLRHDGQLPRPRGRVRPVPAARGRRQRRHPPPHAGHDVPHPGAPAGRALLGRRSARRAGRRRGLRRGDRVPDAREPALRPGRPPLPRPLVRRPRPARSRRAATPAATTAPWASRTTSWRAARIAVRNMIALLGERHGLEPRDAYMLCSLAGDLKIFEIVDAGMWNVGMLRAALRLRLGQRRGSAAIQSPTTWLKRSGSSHIGQWPDSSKTTSSAPGCARLQPGAVGGRDELLVGAPREQRRQRVARDELAVVLQRLVEQDAGAGVRRRCAAISSSRTAWSSAVGSCLSISGDRSGPSTAWKSSCAAASVLEQLLEREDAELPAVAAEVGRALRDVDVAGDPVGCRTGAPDPRSRTCPSTSRRARRPRARACRAGASRPGRTARPCGRPRSPATRRGRAGRR